MFKGKYKFASNKIGKYQRRGKIKDRRNNIYMYGKCPKIWDTKVSDKETCANRADPDQTAPSNLIRVYTVCHSTCIFGKLLHKKQNFG